MAKALKVPVKKTQPTPNVKKSVERIKSNLNTKNRNKKQVGF